MFAAAVFVAVREVGHGKNLHPRVNRNAVVFKRMRVRKGVEG